VHRSEMNEQRYRWAYAYDQGGDWGGDTLYFKMHVSHVVV
jgi:hypothetical protein